ncbi:class I SAM-dependent rRNA methyltransferase [Carnobacteriaceae bacterium zg-ZUI252]|nr:class I SAM-dependent rRNA methyltransferase [Carnobacteriaceae bacterium zg-ZUI252]
MKTIKLKQRAAQHVKSGNPLLIEGDILNTKDIVFGEIVEVVDAKSGAFLGKALLGQQNKGVGWMLTTKSSEMLDAKFLERLLTNAKQKRQSFFASSKIDAFRLFNGESDGLGGLTIDVYKQALVISFYSQAIFTYRQFIFDALKIVMSGYSIFEKCRFEQAPYDTNHVFGKDNEQFIIQENESRFNVHLNDGLMTGIFLDQRDVRDYVRRHAKNKTVLNTFSYTAAFSVAAALGGALKTVSVDVAKRSIELSTQQFNVNALSLENHAFYVMDVFDYFKYARKKGETFDMVVLDPPSFARTKKRTFSVLKNYGELLEDAIHLTNVGGEIIVSTNASNWKRDDVLRMIDETFTRLNRKYAINAEFKQPTDFTTLKTLPSTQYLKVFVVKVVA